MTTPEVRAQAYNRHLPVIRKEISWRCLILTDILASRYQCNSPNGSAMRRFDLRVLAGYHTYWEHVMLEELGLTPTAERIYLTLLEHPWQQPEALQKRLELTSRSVTENITILRTLGIILDNNDAGLTVVPPATATQLLLTRQEASVAALQELIIRSQIMASRFVAEHQINLVNLGNDDNERVFGEQLVISRIAELGAQTRERVDTFAPGGNYPESHITAGKKADLKAFERGVYSRAIFLTSVLTESASRSATVAAPRMLSYLDWLVEQGAEVRTAQELPIRMIISDQKTAILPLDPLSSAMKGILVVKDVGTVRALCALFENLWAAAKPYGTSFDISSGFAADRITIRDREVLSLLSEGMRDSDIATRMGVKERTARSYVKTIGRKLGARSRFELGYKAALAGWRPNITEDISVPPL